IESHRARPATSGAAQLLFQFLVQLLVLLAMLGMARVDQFAPAEMEWRRVIELHIMEGIGEDLGHPDQSGLHALDEEQMHSAEQQPADADREPDQPDLVDELASRLVGRENAEQ